MFTKVCHFIGIFSCIAIIVACFLPWTHYTSINETFTGFHVIRFSQVNYYGRAGIPVTVMASVILVLMLIPKVWAKRVNLFLAALLFAYCIRTYVIFTGSMFEGEVEKRAGIYLIFLLSLLILVTAVFPKLDEKQLSSDGGGS
jgi:hypothetical protein